MGKGVVSILVLVDAALRQTREDRWTPVLIPVSILVLVDAALRPVLLLTVRAGRGRFQSLF